MPSGHAEFVECSGTKLRVLRMPNYAVILVRGCMSLHLLDRVWILAFALLLCPRCFRAGLSSSKTQEAAKTKIIIRPVGRSATRLGLPSVLSRPHLSAVAKAARAQAQLLSLRLVDLLRAGAHVVVLRRRRRGPVEITAQDMAACQRR